MAIQGKFTSVGKPVTSHAMDIGARKTYISYLLSRPDRHKGLVLSGLTINSVQYSIQNLIFLHSPFSILVGLRMLSGSGTSNYGGCTSYHGVCTGYHRGCVYKYRLVGPYIPTAIFFLVLAHELVSGQHANLLKIYLCDDIDINKKN